MDENKILMKTARPVGLVGYGAYVPRYRLPAVEVARVWAGGKTSGLPVKEKAVAGLDEDVITMSIEASRNALARAGISAELLRAVWVGSESHPYAVKPSGTVVAEAIGASASVSAGDWEFACKAGSEAMVAAVGLVGSRMADYALAIGMDTAQGRPGDALEYTAGAGGAAYIIGPAENSLAAILQEIEQGNRKILLDFSGVPYISSRGLRVILATAKKLKNPGDKFGLCSLSPEVFKIMKLAGFTSIFSIFATDGGLWLKAGYALYRYMAGQWKTAFRPTANFLKIHQIVENASGSGMAVLEPQAGDVSPVRYDTDHSDCSFSAPPPDPPGRRTPFPGAHVLSPVMVATRRAGERDPARRPVTS